MRMEQQQLAAPHAAPPSARRARIREGIIDSQYDHVGIHGTRRRDGQHNVLRALLPVRRTHTPLS